VSQSRRLTGLIFTNTKTSSILQNYLCTLLQRHYPIYTNRSSWTVYSFSSFTHNPTYCIFQTYKMPPYILRGSLLWRKLLFLWTCKLRTDFRHNVYGRSASYTSVNAVYLYGTSAVELVKHIQKNLLLFPSINFLITHFMKSEFIILKQHILYHHSKTKVKT
jgi:hypothetical protein